MTDGFNSIVHRHHCNIYLVIVIQFTTVKLVDNWFVKNGNNNSIEKT